MSKQAERHDGLDLDYINSAVHRGKPVSAVRVRALLSRLDTLEYIAEHAKQATVILSAHPATRAGQTLPEAVMALCDEIQRLEACVACLVDLLGDIQSYLHGASYSIPVLQRRVAAALNTESVNSFSSLLSAARAWDDAVERCDGIMAAEEALRRVIRELRP